MKISARKVWVYIQHKRTNLLFLKWWWYWGIYGACWTLMTMVTMLTMLIWYRGTHGAMCESMLDSGVEMLRQIYAKLLPTRLTLPHHDDHHPHDDDDHHHHHPDDDDDVDSYHTLGHMPRVGFMRSHYILSFHSPDNDDNSRNTIVEQR